MCGKKNSKPILIVWEMTQWCVKLHEEGGGGLRTARGPVQKNWHDLCMAQSSCPPIPAFLRSKKFWIWWKMFSKHFNWSKKDLGQSSSILMNSCSEPVLFSLFMPQSYCPNMAPRFAPTWKSALIGTQSGWVVARSSRDESEPAPTVLNMFKIIGAWPRFQ
jgi:hypothetical protein